MRTVKSYLNDNSSKHVETYFDTTNTKTWIQPVDAQVSWEQNQINIKTHQDTVKKNFFYAFVVILGGTISLTAVNWLFNPSQPARYLLMVIALLLLGVGVKTRNIIQQNLTSIGKLQKSSSNVRLYADPVFVNATLDLRMATKIINATPDLSALQHMMLKVQPHIDIMVQRCTSEDEKNVDVVDKADVALHQYLLLCAMFVCLTNDYVQEHLLPSAQNLTILNTQINKLVDSLPTPQPLR